MFPCKMILSSSRLRIRYRYIEPAGLKDPLTFFQHNSNVHLSLVAAHDGVKGRFVNYKIEHFIVVFEISNVHDLPLLLRPLFFISVDHLLDAQRGDVHVPNRSISVIIHIF